MKSRALLVVAALALALPVIRALAQDQETAAPAPARENRLVVHARSRVVAPADELELELVVQGTAEEAREAEKKHRDRLRHVLAGLTGKEVTNDESGDDDEGEKKKPHKKKKARSEDSEALPSPGVPDEDGLVLEVREGRYTLGVKGDPTQNAMEDPSDTNDASKEPELACGSCVHVTLRNVQKSSARKVRRILAAILDRAAEGGADLGPPKTHLKPSLRFRVANAEALKRQAYADAIAKGRARAAELAQLAGRKLGNLTVMSELPEPQQVAQENAGDVETLLATLQASEASAPDTFSGTSEVAVEVRLELEFDLK
jgi:uncharacterized protein YggE